MAALTESDSVAVEPAPSSTDVSSPRALSDATVESENTPNSKGAVEEPVPEIKKFVEAPIPKINPWTVNRGQQSGGGSAKGHSRQHNLGEQGISLIIVCTTHMCGDSCIHITCSALTVLFSF